MDIEEQVMDSDVDFNLREQISEIKNPKPFKKMYIYILAGILVAIVLGVLIYVLIPKTVDTTFDFYLNDSPITTNLTVNISFDGFTEQLITDKNVLHFDLPKDIDFDLEITTPGYSLKKSLYSGEDYYKIVIKKLVTPPNDSTIGVKFSIYDSSSTFNTYNSPITLNLKCLSSGFTDSIVVSGSYNYDKSSDCGSLQISANVSGFSPYLNTCGDTFCSVRLNSIKEVSTLNESNDLVVFVKNKDDNTAIKDVNVVVSRYGEDFFDTTDSLGSAGFKALDLGTYTVKVSYYYLGTNYSKSSSVTVENEASASKTTIYLSLVSGKAIDLFIDANSELNCSYGVEIFDNNSVVVDFDEFDANVNNKISFADLNAGDYYMTVAPLGECALIYAPVYNHEFSYPSESNLKITLEDFDANSMVFLSAIPLIGNAKLSNTNVKVRESDNNRYILESLSDSYGVAGPFILYGGIDYTIVGENSAMSGEVEYLFDEDLDSVVYEDYYFDTVEVPLEFDGVNLSISGNIYDYNDYEVFAYWKSSITSEEQSISFLAENGDVNVYLPAGTDVLLKLTKDIEIEGYNDTLTINYYLNRFNFDKENNYHIDVNLSKDYLYSLLENKTESLGFFNDITLNNSLDEVVNYNEFYFANDVLAFDENLNESCLGKSGNGFLYDIIGSSNLQILDLFSYTLENSFDSTYGSRFLPVFVKSSVKNQVSIFRVVNKVQSYGSGKADLKYSITNDVLENGYDYTNNFNIRNDASVKSFDKEEYDITLSLFGANETNFNLEFSPEEKLLFKNKVLTVDNSKWFAPNNSKCDPYSAKLNNYIGELGLSSLDDKEIDSTGILSANIVPKQSANALDLPINMKLYLSFDLLFNDAKSSYLLPINLTLDRQDFPQKDCFDFSIDDTILIKNYYNVLENKVYYKENTFILDYPDFSDYSKLVYNVFNLLRKSHNNVANEEFYSSINSHLDLSKEDFSLLLENYNPDFVFSTSNAIVYHNNKCGWDFSKEEISSDDKINKLYLINAEYNGVKIPFASYYVVAPKESSAFSLPNNALSPESQLINLEYKNDVDCANTMCSLSQFLDYSENKSNGQVYLSNDNFYPYNLLTNPFLNVGYFGPGYYSYGQNKDGNFLFTKLLSYDENILFYYLPYTEDFLSGRSDIVVNNGFCSNYSNLSFGVSPFNTDCSNSYIKLNSQDKESFSKVFDYSIKDDGNINATLYPGYYTKICGTTSDNCLNDSNSFVLTNKSFYDKKDFFILKDNSYLSLNKEYVVWSFSKSPKTGYDDTFRFALNNKYDLERIYDAYNDGIIKIAENNSIYTYYWNYLELGNIISENETIVNVATNNERSINYNVYNFKKPLPIANSVSRDAVDDSLSKISTERE